MIKVLGIESPRDVKTSILEMAHSLIDKSLIELPRRVKKRKANARLK